MSNAIIPTLPTSASVVNVGLSLFADAVANQGHPVTSVDWRIPAGGDMEVVAALTRLYGKHAATIDAANAEVFRRLEASPNIVGVAAAGGVIPALRGKMLLHCGPPIDYADAKQLGLPIEYLPPDHERWSRYWDLYCLLRLETQEGKKIYESAYASQIV